jgi:hypothetical protein
MNLEGAEAAVVAVAKLCIRTTSASIPISSFSSLSSSSTASASTTVFTTSFHLFFLFLIFTHLRIALVALYNYSLYYIL